LRNTSRGYYGEDSGDIPEPSRDPEEQAMIEHIVEFETEMYRWTVYEKYSRLNSRHLERLMIELHGEEWRDAL
jgi:hypothetical protein